MTPVIASMVSQPGASVSRKRRLEEGGSLVAAAIIDRWPAVIVRGFKGRSESVFRSALTCTCKTVWSDWPLDIGCADDHGVLAGRLGTPGDFTGDLVDGHALKGRLRRSGSGPSRQSPGRSAGRGLAVRLLRPRSGKEWWPGGADDWPRPSVPAPRRPKTVSLCCRSSATATAWNVISCLPALAGFQLHLARLRCCNRNTAIGRAPAKTVTNLAVPPVPARWDAVGPEGSRPIRASAGRRVPTAREPAWASAPVESTTRPYRPPQRPTQYPKNHPGDL